jgi:hypothetical protein
VVDYRGQVTGYSFAEIAIIERLGTMMIFGSVRPGTVISVRQCAQLAPEFIESGMPLIAILTQCLENYVS